MNSVYEWSQNHILFPVHIHLALGNETFLKSTQTWSYRQLALCKLYEEGIAAGSAFQVNFNTFWGIEMVLLVETCKEALKVS